MNEVSTIGGVLDQLKRLQPDSLIVVSNGSTDQTESIAHSKGATVLSYPLPLGNDLGRALGAMQAEADIYLFTDADIVIPARELLPLIREIELGKDVAINSVDWVTKHPIPDVTAADRYLLNQLQRRPDLKVENVLSIPHAFSARALGLIKKGTLANPLLANAISVDQQLQISVPTNIDVLRMNKLRDNHVKKAGEVMPEAYQRMHGDTLEAFQYLFKQHGSRLGYLTDERSFFRLSDLSPLLKQSWKAAVAARERSMVIAVSPEFVANLDTILMNANRAQAEVIAVVSGQKETVEPILKKMERSVSIYNGTIG